MAQFQQFFFENFHIFVPIELVKTCFLNIQEYYQYKIVFFCHLYTLIDGKMIKNGSYSPNKFKIAFRVPNNCAMVVLQILFYQHLSLK
jgi:hypothetical protein